MEEQEEDFRHEQSLKSSELEKQISVDPHSLNQASHAMPTISPPLPPCKLNYRRKKKTKKKKQKLQPTITPLQYRHSTELTVPADLSSPELRRSKSCGDGRTSSPAEELDLVSSRLKTEQTNGDPNSYRRDSISNEAEGDSFEKAAIFKCSALCLFISRKKPTPPVQRTKTEQQKSFGVSRVVSMERFECGSWASGAINDHGEDESDGRNDESGPLSYFDLPLELIRCSAADSCSAVKTAFVFDKDLKGVLKKSGSRRSCESATRHVRFSTSAPTSFPASPNLSPCVTPRLMRARDELNALLEATGG